MKSYRCEECGAVWPMDEAMALTVTDHERASGHHVYILNVPGSSEPAGTYQLLYGDTAIKCLRCGLVSHNTNDVAHRYCGRCQHFHDA